MKPLCYIFAFLFSSILGSAALDQPNIVVVMTDDQGWGDLGIHGNTIIETPHLDRLAAEGVQFTHFYVQPVCSPTRAELLTGRYYPRSGVFSTSRGGERIDLDEETLADAFKSAGYDTGVFGKWHSGSQYPYHPLGRGFNEFYGFTSGHWGLYFSPMIEHNGAITRGTGYLVDDCTDRTIAFIEKNAEQSRPFFAFLAMNTPHSPMQVPDRWWSKYQDRELPQRGTWAEKEDLDHTRAALAMVENIDWNVGRLLDRIQALGLDENTVVVFLSDNGPNGHRWNGGMRGKKGSTDEGGVRSPLFVRWTGKLAAGRTVNEIAGAIDLFPTLVDLAGIVFQPQKPWDGISLKPLLLGTAEAWKERHLVASWNGKLSVRNQRFRLDDAGRLYDLETDPNQEHDLSALYPEVADELTRYGEAWVTDVSGDKGIRKSNTEDAERPLPVGHADFNSTLLPARDANATGQIERSNRYPNDSYFKNWIAEEDEIQWEVEVLTSGLYAAEVWYACTVENVGSTIELKFKDATTSVVVHEPHDPPLLGLEQTRSTLQESPVKMFRRMGMGTIALEAGKGTLRLRAIEIPHREAMEFRLLTLTRIRPNPN